MPLLWNIAVNELLQILEEAGCKVIAYADDVAIAITGKFVSILRDIMQNALNRLEAWTQTCGLSVNPQKTDLGLSNVGVREFLEPAFDKAKGMIGT